MYLMCDGNLVVFIWIPKLPVVYSLHKYALRLVLVCSELPLHSLCAKTESVCAVKLLTETITVPVYCSGLFTVVMSTIVVWQSLWWAKQNICKES